MDLSKFKQGDGGGDFEPAPEGVHSAVCIAVIDLGTQVQSKFQSTEVEEVPLLEIRWELDAERDDGKPFMIMKRYRKSLHEKASLRLHLEAWRGKPFSDAEFGPGGFLMENLLGKGCQIQVGRTDSGKAKIMAIMKLGKGMKPIEASIEPFIIDLESPKTFDKDAFAGLSENMQSTIAKSPEYQALLAARKGNGAKPATQQARQQVEHTEELEDEIPF